MSARPSPRTGAGAKQQTSSSLTPTPASISRPRPPSSRSISNKTRPSNSTSTPIKSSPISPGRLGESSPSPPAVGLGLGVGMGEEEREKRERAFVAYFRKILANTSLNPNDGDSPDGFGSGEESGGKGAEFGFEDLRDGRIIAEALRHEEPDHFKSLPSSSTSNSTSTPSQTIITPNPTQTQTQTQTPTQKQTLRNLKIIYHSLLTCPSSSLSSFLPIPDLVLLSSPSSSSLRTTNSQKTKTAPQLGTAEEESVDKYKWREELLKLCAIVLLVQAVWSRFNEGVVLGIMMQLGREEQGVLKGVIEEGMGCIPKDLLEAAAGTSGEESNDQPDEIDSLYQQQVFRSSLFNENSALKIALQEEREKVRALSASVSRTGTPTRGAGTKLTPSGVGRGEGRVGNGSGGGRGVSPVSGLEDNLGDEEGTNDDEEENENDSSSPLPITPLRPKKSSNGTATALTSTSTSTSVAAQSPMDRMRTIEIDRLKGEVNDAREEVGRLEGVVEGLRGEVGAHLGKIESLTKDLDQIQPLRDELEVRQHAADNLKKSEVVVERLKKRLEALEGVEEELRQLEAQNKELVEANTAMEQKFKEYKSASASTPATTASLPSDLSPARPTQSEYHLQSLTRDLDRVRLDLREREDELELARARVQELEMEGSLAEGEETLDDVDVLGVEGEGEGNATKAQLRQKIRHLEQQLASSSIADISASSSRQNTLADDERLQLRMEILAAKEEAADALAKVETLDAKYLKAQKVLREQHEILEKKAQSGEKLDAGEVEQRNKGLEAKIKDLESQIAQCVNRFHLERTNTQRALHHLGQRAAKSTRPPAPAPAAKR